MESPKENIVDYAKRMRELCGLTNTKYKEFLQNENYQQFADEARQEADRGFKIYEIESKEVKSSKEDNELYKLKK